MLFSRFCVASLTLSTIGLIQDVHSSSDHNCTDFFDLGDDLTSHDYTQYGDVSIGSYTCNEGTDATLRTGSGSCSTSLAGSNYTFTMLSGTDIGFVIAWQNEYAEIYVDGELLGNTSALATSCDYIWFELPYTTEGTIEVSVVDPLDTCDGDSQIASVCVKGNHVMPTTTEGEEINEAELVADNTYICIDEIDLGEDMSSHDFSSVGKVSVGAYTCDDGEDATLRVGSCSGVGNATWTMDNGDQLIFTVAWQSDDSEVYVDGELLGVISGAGNCNNYAFDLPDTDADTIEVTVVDPTLGCDGDIQIASACVSGDVVASTVTDDSFYCVDEFDAGEDMSSHDFSSEGETSVGDYTCDDGEDSTLRIGDCSVGKGNATWTMDNGDEIIFTVAWQNDDSEVYIDGVLIGTISGAGNCNDYMFDLPDTDAETIEVTVVDPTIGCDGDIQIASVCVTGDAPSTSTPPRDCSDEIDLGEDISSHEFSSVGKVSVGAYTCDNGTDATLRVGSCSGKGNATWTMGNGDALVFVVAWQNDYSDIYIDGVLLGTISGAGNCGEVSFDLPDTDADTIEVTVADPTLGCEGDIQIASACVTDSEPSTTGASGSDPVTTGTSGTDPATSASDEDDTMTTTVGTVYATEIDDLPDCIDEIDLGEDTTSHDYSSSGLTSIGAYSCDGTNDTIDATLRLGSCSSGTGSATWTMDNGDEIIFTVGWQNDESEVYINGELLGLIADAGNCNSYSLSLPDTSDATIEVMVVDPTLGCEGDIQMTRACVTSSGTIGTGDASLDDCDDYIDLGEDMTSHDFSSEGLTSIGAYACTESADSTSGVPGVSGTSDATDATLRLGSCYYGTGNATWTMQSGDVLGFRVAWQNSESEVYVDGVLLGTISGGGNCNDVSFDLPETTASTIEVTVVDPTIGCEGDIQIAAACVTSSAPTAGGNQSAAKMSGGLSTEKMVMIVIGSVMAAMNMIFG